MLEKLSVKAVRMIHSGGIAIETTRESDLRTLRECKKFGEIGLQVNAPRAIGAKIIVYDVPNEMTGETFMSALYEKNLKEVCTSANEFKERVRIVSRLGKKECNVANVIVELHVGRTARMPPNFRYILLFIL